MHENTYSSTCQRTRLSFFSRFSANNTNSCKFCLINQRPVVKWSGLNDFFVLLYFFQSKVTWSDFHGC